MICKKERARFDNEMGRLKRLWADLNAAAPSKKPAIVKKILAQEPLVDEARDELEACIRAHTPPSEVASSVDATLDIAFESKDKSATFHENGVTRTFNFTGPTTARKYFLDDILVTRKATIGPKDWVTLYNIMLIRGSLNKTTGLMGFSATVQVTFDGKDRGHVPVQLQTGHVTSSSYDLTGSPLTGTTFKLVGTGQASLDTVTLDFMMTIDGVFASAP